MSEKLKLWDRVRGAVGRMYEFAMANKVKSAVFLLALIVLLLFSNNILAWLNVVGPARAAKWAMITMILAIFLGTKVIVDYIVSRKPNLKWAALPLEWGIFLVTAFVSFIVFDEALDEDGLFFFGLMFLIPAVGFSLAWLGRPTWGRLVLMRLGTGLLLLTLVFPLPYLRWYEIKPIESDDRSSAEEVTKYEVTALTNIDGDWLSRKFWAQRELRSLIFKPSNFDDEIKKFNGDENKHEDASMGAWTIGRRKSLKDGAHPRYLDIYPGEGLNGQAVKKVTWGLIAALGFPLFAFGGFIVLGLLLPQIVEKLKASLEAKRAARKAPATAS